MTTEIAPPLRTRPLALRLGLTVLPLVALALAAVCVWRAQRPEGLWTAVGGASVDAAMPAPLFEGLDEGNQFFRLVRYVGRHRVVVVFYDGALGVDQSAEVLALRSRFGEILRRNAKVVAVSTALPQFNRAAIERCGRFPFELVSDVDGSIHQRWGRWDQQRGQPQAGMFVIDRKGYVKYDDSRPASLSTVEEVIQELKR